MPAVSSYLSKDVFENVKARERLLKILSEKKPLNGNSSWEEIHQERTLADVGRSCIRKRV